MIKKKGQFYLIGAIVIILIIFGFFGVRNVIKSDKDSERIYDLRDELNFESVSVVEYGLYKQKPEEMKQLLDDFTDKYIDFAGQGKNLYFIFGNENEVIIKGQEEVLSGSIGIQIGETISNIPTLQEKKYYQIFQREGSNQIIVKIKDQDYNINLQRGQNFYFIISQERGNETQVVSG